MNDVRVVRPQERDASTAQTPGMTRVAGISPATCGASGVWMGEVTTEPRFRSGAHHHGDVESAIYVLRGRLRMRWGERLEHALDAEPGDFVFVPARTVHQEMSVSDEQLVIILARGSAENVVVNVELPDEVVAGPGKNRPPSRYGAGVGGWMLEGSRHASDTRER